MAQGTLFFQPIQRMFQGGTNTVPNCKAYFFLAGTSTPTTVYADVALTIPLTQPVVADANGVFVEIFLVPGTAYKVDVQTSSGVSLPGYPADNQIAIPSSISPTFTGVAQDFRLSLTTGVSVTTSDVVGATLFFTPHIGRRCTVFDATGVATTLLSPEISLAVPATVNQVYDVFVFNNGGTLAAELLAWTNDTTRAVGITKSIGGNDAWGIYVKNGDLTRRYIGSIRTTTVSGQVADTQTQRFCWNYYNRVRRPLQRLETIGAWTYTLGTIRQANGSAANQVDLITGVAESPLWLMLVITAVGNPAAANLRAGIGVNSTTTFASTGGWVQTTGVSNAWIPPAVYEAIPAAGRNFYAWNEVSDVTGTTTWYGTIAPGSAPVQAAQASGLYGWIDG